MFILNKKKCYVNRRLIKLIVVFCPVKVPHYSAKTLKLLSVFSLKSYILKYELKIKLNDLYYLVRMPNYSAEHKQTIYRIMFEFKRLVKRRKRNLKRHFQSNKIETFFDF
jgi:hypothetical protein